MKAHFDFEPSECLLISAKDGIGIEEVFRKIIEDIPAPQFSSEDLLKIFLFDARYIPTRGV